MIYPQIPTSITTLRAKVDIYNGDTLAATCSCSDFLQDFTIHKEGDTNKFFGFGVSHKLDINFIDIEKQLKTKIEKGSKLVIKMGDGTTFYDVYPPMYVAEVTRNEKTNNISCVAYDVLYKTKTLTVTDLFNYIAEGHESYPDPLWISHIIQACGRLLTDGQLGSQLTSTSAIQNFSYVVNNQFNLNGDEPLKVLLDAIAEFTQTIYYMDHLGRLTYKTLNYHDSPVLTIDKDKYFDLVTSEPKAISGLCLTNELGDSITAGDESGEVQIIRNNPIYEAEPNRAVYLEKAMAVVLGSYGQYNTVFTPLVYHQLECEWDGNCNLSPGDKVAFVTEDDSIVTTYLINDVIEYQGFLNEVTSWEYTQDEAETADNPTTLGEKIKQTVAKVDKVNQEIDLIAKDVDGVNSEIAQIKLTTDDIILRVEKVEKQEIEIDLDLTNDTNFIALSERVGQLEISDTNITASVSSLETTLRGEIDTAIGNLDTTLKEEITQGDNALNDEIVAVKQSISALEIENESITASVSSLEVSTTTNLNNAVSDLEGNINELEDTLRNELQTGDNALSGEITTVKQDVSSLQIKTNAIEASVSSLESSTSTNLSNAISGITDNLSELEEALRTEFEEADSNLNDSINSEFVAVRQDISSLIVETDGITASVSSLQKITEQSTDSLGKEITSLAKEVNLKVDSEAVSISIAKALDAGVDKVKTSTKNYTFDDDGLNISSSDSEFNTNVDENGMRIYKGSTEVLTANNEGVTATDLHARTFLIIGENSRLEDRGNRTACFWIGKAGG